MRICSLIGIVACASIASAAAWAQSSGPPANASAPSQTSTVSIEEMKQEIENLKKTLGALEQRLSEQEKQNQPQKQPAAAAEQLAADVKELDQRVSTAERGQALDRLRITGDFRFEAHSIMGHVPAHYDGMTMQNLLVKTMFSMPILGRPPSSVNEINSTVNKNWAGYQQFLSNLSFNNLKQAMGTFPAPMQQQLFGMLMPSAFTPAYHDNNDILYTNRLRLDINARVADNVSFTGRLSMYKVFGDSTGVQTFNGQPTSLNIDGSTAGVPNSDQLRVERAYFSWNQIGGSKFYLSVGRRPSTEGPPMNYRQDELRGGTPSGALIDYQFDGLTLGYNVSENTVLRLCYGLGYESGWGNANLLKLPQDRLKDVHFLGANFDFWNTEKTLIQLTVARAFNVSDGFDGLTVLPNNPLTGEVVPAPVVMRYTPSANLGDINLYGINLTRRARDFDLYFSGNMNQMRPNGKTTPFGGLLSDPFDAPQDHTGYMVLAGVRYSVPANDGRTKLGFEYNKGSKYWFNFAQASDDIIAPKTNTRGGVYETYLTHRINDRFILKADFIKYLYDYSGSGWHVGAPKQLDSSPILGFPAYQGSTKLSIGLTTRF